MYAVYHGPEGLTAIAHRVHALAHALATTITTGRGATSGYTLANGPVFFDTITIDVGAKVRL